MKCVIFATEETGSKIAGVIKLKNGEVTAQAAPGYEKTISFIMDETMLTDKGTTKLTRAADPEQWFNALPDNYNGSMIQAQMIDKADDS